MKTEILTPAQLAPYRKLVMEHFRSLSKDDLYFRFMQSKNDYSLNEWFDKMLTDEEISHKFVVVFSRDNPKILALTQLSIIKDASYCEIAVSVSPEARYHGLAKKSINTLVDIARNAGIPEVIMMCCGNNNPMAVTGISCGFTLSYSHRDIVLSKIL